MQPLSEHCFRWPLTVQHGPTVQKVVTTALPRIEGALDVFDVDVNKDTPKPTPPSVSPPKEFGQPQARAQVRGDAGSNFNRDREVAVTSSPEGLVLR